MNEDHIDTNLLPLTNLINYSLFDNKDITGQELMIL